MMNETNKPLSEVLFAFAIAMPTPNAGTLDDFVRRYPEHAEALTDFAVDLALDSDRGESDEAEPVPAGTSPAVAKAISHFHNVVFDLEKKAVGNANPPINPLSNLSRDEFCGFADRLGVNPLFASKLRDRLIDPATIVTRPGFCQAAADAAFVPIDVMVAHFKGPSEISRQAHYKSEGKPVVGAQQAFEEAVRKSGLTEDQQRHLLGL